MFSHLVTLPGHILHVYGIPTSPDSTQGFGQVAPLLSDDRTLWVRATAHLRVAVRSELNANVFPSRHFTMCDLVRYTQTSKVVTWHPPDVNLPTIVHRAVDVIKRKQFCGAHVNLMVSRTTILEPGAMHGARGFVAVRNSVQASQFNNHLLSNVRMCEGVTCVHREVFSGTPLKAVWFPRSITFIGASGFRETLLKEIDLSHATMLEAIEQRAFQHCVLLRKVRLPISVKHVGSNCFDACTNLQHLHIDAAARMRVIEAGCYQHTHHLLRAPITDALLSIQQNGFKSSGITVVDLTNSGVQCIGDAAFSQCNSLVSFSGSTATMSLGASVFADCPCLETLDLSMAKGLTFLPSGFCENCTVLRRACLPHGLRSIRHAAFRNCRALQSILLPPTVGSIGALAFAGTRNLKSIVLNGSSLPEMHATCLKHSGAVVVSRFTKRPHESDAVVAVPSATALRSSRFTNALLAYRLANADHHRVKLRERIATRRRHHGGAGITHADTTRERRHRKVFADMTVLPIELWFLVFEISAVWPLKAKSVHYFPKLLYKPALNVWKAWLHNGDHPRQSHTTPPPLLTFLFNECTQADVKFIAHHTWVSTRTDATNTPLATQVYETATGKFPECMTDFNASHQHRVVESLKALLLRTSADRDAVDGRFYRETWPKEII